MNSIKKIYLFSYKSFYEKKGGLYVWVNDVLSLIIVASVVSITLESVPQFSEYRKVFDGIEYTAVVIFSMEYIMRLVGSPKKSSYIFSFFGIIDLLSILPTWLHAANLTPLKSVRVLRILRFLRVLRLIKVARINHLKKVTKRDSAQIIKINLWIYIISLLFVITILGNLAYIFEYGNPRFESVPLSMLWVFESLLGGSISATIPQTYMGIVIFMVARFSSFILLGFMIHIVGNIISHLLLGKKARHTTEI